MKTIETDIKKPKIISQITAILIFAQSARAEASQKKLGKSVALFKELNRQVLATSRKTGLPYFLFSEKEQEGSNFGDRFANAIAAVYAKGYDNVISIGNDTPHLTVAHILSAQKELERSPLVLGPSTDGGFYLMGLRNSHFQPAQFKKLPWQSAQISQVMLNTLSRKQTTCTPHLLETLSDLDSVADLELLLKTNAGISERIIRLVRNILSRTVVLTPYATQHFFESLTKTYFNKGSPLLVRI